MNHGIPGVHLNGRRGGPDFRGGVSFPNHCRVPSQGTIRPLPYGRMAVSAFSETSARSTLRLGGVSFWCFCRFARISDFGLRISKTGLLMVILTSSSFDTAPPNCAAPRKWPAGPTP